MFGAILPSIWGNVAPARIDLINKKNIDVHSGLCYIKKAKLAGFFFMSKKWPKAKLESATREIGGGYCARKDHIGVYRLQTTQLQHD